MVMPRVAQYLGDMSRKFRSFARRWWLLCAGFPWALRTSGQVINCNDDTSLEVEVPFLSQAQLVCW